MGVSQVRRPRVAWANFPRDRASPKFHSAQYPSIAAREDSRDTVTLSGFLARIPRIDPCLDLIIDGARPFPSIAFFF
jgi:hypothetical protein